MHNDEQVFDYMAAAEETGKQLDEMVRRIPGEMKAVLADEWRQSAWLVELPKIAEKAMAATEKTEAASDFLNRSINRAGLVIMLAAVIVPLATWAVTKWEMRGLQSRQAELEDTIDCLSATLSALKSQTGGGLELVTYTDGTRGVILPIGSKFQHEAQTKDNRNVVVYK